MKHYNTFIFDSYAFDEKTGTITLNYSLDDEVKFTETLVIPVPSRPERPLSLDAALFALHLIGGISYYKTCLPKKIEIRSGNLTKDQAAFWNTVYENGLGEFFYQNKIDFRGLINLPATAAQSSKLTAKSLSDKPHASSKRCLVPIGGGKDSIVTIELLKKAGFDVTLFRMEAHPIIDELAKIADLPMITVKRSLSPALFELNKDGALNGHIPITAYLSFVTIITAMLHGFDAVVMSNERSSNYGNVEYLGKDINHQWSKSLAFENAFEKYVHTNITPDIRYFSLLRPLSEIHIARIYSRYPQYFSKATSCNANWKILARHEEQSDEWCRKCPKCAFVFAILSPFISKDTLIGIFGGNLFDDESLLPLYRELLAIEGFKPFECVGTPEETLTALILAHEKGEWNDSKVMQMALEEAVMPDNVRGMVEEQFTMSKDHAIPEEFLSVLNAS